MSFGAGYSPTGLFFIDQRVQPFVDDPAPSQWYHDYRRPLSRENARYFPWNTRWSQWGSLPLTLADAPVAEYRLGPHSLSAGVGIPAQYVPPGGGHDEHYGYAECIGGIPTLDKCNKALGMHPVCDGPSGSRAICTNLRGNSGCMRARGLWCPG